MARLDMRSFPELRNLGSDRERATRYARSRRRVDPGTEIIVHFWEEVAERLDNEDDLTAMSNLLSELEHDINILRALRETTRGARDNPERSHQHDLVVRMLNMLLNLLDRFRKRHWQLKDQALRYAMLLNPAIPSKVLNRIEEDQKKPKDRKALKSRKKAEKAVNEAQKPKGAAGKGNPDQPQKRPGKKMSP